MAMVIDLSNASLHGSREARRSAVPHPRKSAPLRHRPPARCDVHAGPYARTRYLTLERYSRYNVTVDARDRNSPAQSSRAPAAPPAGEGIHATDGGSRGPGTHDSRPGYGPSGERPSRASECWRAGCCAVSRAGSRAMASVTPEHQSHLDLHGYCVIKNVVDAATA